MSLPEVLTDWREVHDRIDVFRRGRETVGLVPTMGALHAGHLSLVRASGERCDRTVVTIFVNPSQFPDPADLDLYPRSLDDDLKQLTPHAVDFVFAPPVESMYPPGFSTYIDVPRAAEQWEGVTRPGHFRGVATIVLKLFHIAPADIAFFGQKDIQQVRVIERMVVDLNLSIRVATCPTVREGDGLALSSRNRHLSGEQRKRALGLWHSLERAQQLVTAGEDSVPRLLAEMRQELERHGVDSIDYVTIADPDSLEELPEIRNKPVAMVAAVVGDTRLIDNLVLDG